MKSRKLRVALAATGCGGAKADTITTFNQVM
jgi:hypothetical protein